MQLLVSDSLRLRCMIRLRPDGGKQLDESVSLEVSGMSAREAGMLSTLDGQRLLYDNRKVFGPPLEAAIRYGRPWHSRFGASCF